MDSIDFNDSTLMVSARSPFARRVRLAFLEHGVRFEEKVFDVFKPNPELSKLNPLSRVPTLQLKSGEVLIESHLILQAFYESRASDWLPTETKERLECFRWSGIATGICEKLVEHYLEMLKPEVHRDQEILEEVRRAIEGVLPRLEAAVTGQDMLVGRHLTQADLDVGTMLAYTTLRYSDDWKTRFPKARRYFDHLDARPSFQKTRPPQPS